jgi:ketosteroid isomerase-like protein
MSPDKAEIVRTPVSAAARSHRRLEERLALRFPRLTAALIRAVLRLPVDSRLRRGLVGRFLRQGTEALNRGDYEAVFSAFYALDCEFDPGPRFRSLGMEATRGRESRIRFQERWIGEWGDFQFAPEEVVDLGDDRRLMLVGRVSGMGPSSGAVFDDEWAALLTIADGQVVREEVYFDHAEAWRAAGLAE